MLLPNSSPSDLKIHGYKVKSPVTGKKEKIISLIFKTERKEALENYRL